MSWVWAVLGGLLIAAVLAVCLTFFVVRPALAKRINSAGQQVARELHGRPPLRSGAASCEGITDPDRLDLRGVGVIAMTENAAVFATSKSERTLIIPRDRISAAFPATSFDALARSVKRPRPMLIVAWTDGRDNAQQIAFTLDQTEMWVSELAQSPGSIAAG